MITTDTTQYVQECESWKTSLRHHREKFLIFQKELVDLVTHPGSKAHLPEVEHLHNQFEVQLGNIHDLKHAISEHQRLSDWETKHDNNITNQTMQKHDDLREQVRGLEESLSELKNEFSRFRVEVG